MSVNDRLIAIRHVFLDMDGTLYQGDQVLPGTLGFLNFLEQRGIGRTFLSNNSSYGKADYAAKLSKMGIAATSADFYSSTDFCLDYLEKHFPAVKKVFVLGMPCLKAAFAERNYQVVDDDPQLVIVGFDRELVYERLCRAAYFLHCGVPGIATHPDVFCPTDQPTWLVDCGAITACLEKTTAKTLTVLGKPDPGMLRCAAGKLGLAVSETLMVGDRLSTDIALGKNAGALTCHLNARKTEFAKPGNPVPDLVFADLAGLYDHWSKLLTRNAGKN